MFPQASWPDKIDIWKIYSLNWVHLSYEKRELDEGARGSGEVWKFQGKRNIGDRLSQKEGGKNGKFLAWKINIVTFDKYVMDS